MCSPCLVDEVYSIPVYSHTSCRFILHNEAEPKRNGAYRLIASPLPRFQIQRRESESKLDISISHKDCTFRYVPTGTRCMPGRAAQLRLHLVAAVNNYDGLVGQRTRWPYSDQPYDAMRFRLIDVRCRTWRRRRWRRRCCGTWRRWRRRC